MDSCHVVVCCEKGCDIGVRVSFYPDIDVRCAKHDAIFKEKEKSDEMEREDVYLG